jgi:hypothetical protein
MIFVGVWTFARVQATKAQGGVECGSDNYRPWQQMAVSRKLHA